MASSKEVMLHRSALNAEVINELLPSAQRIALLYHVSYLCLAGFPKLERLLRSRALETQLLFGSSEALLIKCIGTSDNLVNSLFPLLKAAVEKNKPTLAVKYLEKAKAWITNIIIEVDQIVEKYNSLNKNVATTTSDVITAKVETDELIESVGNELEAAEAILNQYKAKLEKITDDLVTVERKLNDKSHELEKLVKDISGKNTAVGIVTSLVPFVGPLINAIYKAATEPGDKAKIKALETEINRIISEKSELRQKEWDLQNEVISLQMKVAKLRINLGSIPSPEHLDEVQLCLSRIQQILVQLQKFWEKVGAMLDYLKDKTFVGEELTEELLDFKDEFLQSITTAEEVWTKFGAVCERASSVFSNQAKDAYKFLEVSPTSLSKEEWQCQYDAVKEKLELIKPCSPAPLGTGTEESVTEKSATSAITQ
ncbi:uncharacterized protein LOC115821783 [Chanos chanos]|uniref:Uncharacterized protein LOC115821783 n=1 Tax=Chanos chanos TaxID=29144 RepID=A0A6J2WAN0_CHACN|nr:uncharacterized protein LOC115821783 [Chanos chanos]